MEAVNCLKSITNYVREHPEHVAQRMVELLNSTKTGENELFFSCRVDSSMHLQLFSCVSLEMNKGNVCYVTNLMTCIWNISANWQMKEIIIKSEVIKAISKFLDPKWSNQTSWPEVTRHATGLLMPISVCESGKNSFNENTDIIAQLCVSY